MGKKGNEKILRRIKSKLTGSTQNLRGDTSGLWGDVFRDLCGEISLGLYGDVTGLSGKISSGLQGDISGLWGDVTNIVGIVTNEMTGNIQQYIIEEEKNHGE